MKLFHLFGFFLLGQQGGLGQGFWVAISCWGMVGRFGGAFGMGGVMLFISSST